MVTDNSQPIISERDQKLLDVGDDNFKPYNWEQVVEIVESNDLSKFTRKPSELKKYLLAKHEFKLQYGGVLQYIVQHRLHWAPNEFGKIVPENPEFLGSPSDVKILPNDFPYGVEKGIVHLVIWSKAKIPQDEEGYLHSAAKDRIEKFIVRTFVEKLGLPREQILFFKNWAALQSVPALEHFHVFLRNPPQQVDDLIGTAGVLE